VEGRIHAAKKLLGHKSGSAVTLMYMKPQEERIAEGAALKAMVHKSHLSFISGTYEAQVNTATGEATFRRVRLTPSGFRSARATQVINAKNAKAVAQAASEKEKKLKQETKEEKLLSTRKAASK
jgi:hypothetical protein